MLSTAKLLLVAVISLALNFNVRAGTDVDAYSTCLTNFSVLEQAVVEVGDNRYNIIKAFYTPTSSSPSVYVKVKYISVNNSALKGTWLWTKVPIYFIYPPGIFQYTSLNFNYHITTKQVQDNLTIQLPAACYNMSTCPNSNESILHNRYLDVLTSELYLYAQYNGKNARVVFDNEPSTSLRYDCHSLNHTDQSEKISFYLFSGFCLLLPFGLLLLFMILVHTCRPKIHNLFIHTPPESSRNQNYAALVLTGIVFSVYVLLCDGFAMECALNSVDEGDTYQSDRIPYIIAMIFVIDSVSVLIAIFNIIILACNKQRTRFMMCYACCFARVCFCRRLKYHKIRGIDQYNYTSSKDNGNKTEKERDHRENKLHQEKKLWLLMISFVAPLICIGTHASFVIMAWSSDPGQASSTTMIFIISFIYYFLGFRQLYVMLTSGPCIQKSKHKPVTLSPVESDDLTKPVYIKLIKSTSNKCDQFSSSLSTSTLTPSPGTLQRSSSATDLHSNEYTEWRKIQCKPKINWKTQNLIRHTCVPLVNDGEIVGPSKDFNFVVLVGELFVATLILAIIEGLTVAVYLLLPAPVSTVPSNVLNILHLALLIGGGLVAYKLLTFQTPTEQLLLKSVLDSYNPNAQNQISSQEITKQVGNILGDLLKKFKSKEG